MEEIDTRHIVLQAAGECMSPDQYAAIEALAATDPDVYQRFLACIEKRIARKEPTDEEIIDLAYECDATVGASEFALLDFARAVLRA